MDNSLEDDLALLKKVVRKGEELLEEDDGRVSGAAINAFREMYARLSDGFASTLSEKQRKWAKGVWARLNDEPEYENLVSNGLCPRGREDAGG